MFEKIKAFFSGILRKFKAFLDEALPIALQIIMAQLQDIALMAVREMAATNFSNADKRNAAFQKIKEYAVNKGIQTKDSLIYALIELAVLKIKKDF